MTVPHPLTRLTMRRPPAEDDSRKRGRLRALAAGRQGVAAVEFAVITPLVVAVALAVTDLGIAANEAMRLTSAARAGAQYAMRHPTDSSGTTSTARTAAAGIGSVSVQLNRLCGCSDGSTVSCSASCTTGALRSFVQVTVSESYPLLVAYPGIGTTIPLSSTATFRYQ